MGATNGKQKEDFAQAAAITREAIADMIKARNNDTESGAGQGQTINQTPVHPSRETASQTLARCNRSVMDADLHSGRNSRWLSGKPSPSQLITTVTTVPSPLQTAHPPQNTSDLVATATQTEWPDELKELTYFDMEAARAMFLWNAIQIQASALVLYFFWYENGSCNLHALKYWAAAYTAYIAVYSVIGGLTFWNRERLAKYHPLLNARLQMLCDVLSSSNVVWFVVGNILVFGPTNGCPVSPIYTLSVTFLAINYFQLSFLIVPMALIIVFMALYLIFSCICLPCYCLCGYEMRRRRAERFNSDTLNRVRKWFRPPTPDTWTPYRLFTLFPHPVSVGVIYLGWLGMCFGLCFCPAQTHAFMQVLDEHIESTEARAEERRAAKAAIQRV